MVLVVVVMKFIITLKMVVMLFILNYLLVSQKKRKVQPMTDEQLFWPLKAVLDFARTYVIHLGEHYFTFADIWIWSILIVIIIWFVRFLLDD